MPPSYNDDALHQTALARDTRTSTSHPLRHAALNLVRKVADLDTQQSQGSSPVENRTNYLLTSRTVFLSHEPCIMCSMALLHSRVKDVFYILPMKRTGGCGGATSLPMLQGVNHRFDIYVWNFEQVEHGLQIDEKLDA